MDSDKNVGGRDRLVRAVLAVVLSIVAARWLKAGKKGRGLLASAGAFVFGFNATTGYCGANDALDIDTTAGDISDESTFDTSESTSVDTSVSSVDTASTDTASTDSIETDTATTETDSAAETTAAEETADQDDEPTCEFCGKPIVTGQRRGPNEQGQIVHEDCP